MDIVKDIVCLTIQGSFCPDKFCEGMIVPMSLRKRGLATFALVILVAVILVLVMVNQQAGDPLQPLTNNGQKWRIGYYEGGGYFEYQNHMIGLIHGLVEHGWMEPVEIPMPDDPEDNYSIWQFLAENAESQYIEFVADAFWSADWDSEKRPVVADTIITRLNEIGDIDLMLALGTWAGQDLANDRHSVPTVVISTSNALDSGIIASVEDSGFDHIHAQIDPNQYYRQARLFHSFVEFDRLGVIYENTSAGRTYSNLTELEAIAAERNFELVLCEVMDSNADIEETLKKTSACLEEMAPNIDTFWVASHRGLSTEFMPGILQPLFDNNVPTWSPSGDEQVQRGILLSVARQGFDDIGLWLTDVIAQIFHGTKPRDIGQVFEMPTEIVINMEVARRIGFEPPPSLLEVADHVYEDILGDDD